MNYKLLILGIFLGMVLTGLIYWVYNYVNTKNDQNSTSSTVGATKNYLLDGAITIPMSRYFKKNSTGNRFCIELWLFINPDTIVNLKNDENANSLNIFKIGDTKVSLDLYKDTSLKVKINNPTTQYTITNSFFMQKWQQVIISVDQYLVDLYLDGKIIHSVVSGDLPQIPTSNDKIVFTSIPEKSDIYVSGINIKQIAMDPATALSNYKNGKSKVNGSTQVSLALTKNENVSKNFVIF